MLIKSFIKVKFFTLITSLLVSNLLIADYNDYKKYYDKSYNIYSSKNASEQFKKFEEENGYSSYKQKIIETGKIPEDDNTNTIPISDDNSIEMPKD